MSDDEGQVPLDKIHIPEHRHRPPRDVESLARSMDLIGQLNPIVIAPDGAIRAGARRYLAAKSLGWSAIEAVTAVWDGEHAPMMAELAEIDENLIRAELTVLERAEHIARRKVIYETLHPEASRPKGGRPKKGEQRTPTFSEDMGSVAKLSRNSINEHVRIATAIGDDLKAAIRGTEIEDSTSTLRKLSALSDAGQAQVVDDVESGAAKDVKAALRQVKRKAKSAALAAKSSQPLPGDDTGRTWPVIYADPPWQYADATTDPTRQIENQYPTMPIEDIRALPVGKMATEDAVLFLWATSPLLPEALSVVTAWGFTYKTSMIWDKVSMGMGRWARIQHEILIVATRGDIPVPLPESLARSVHREKSGKHSAKPEWFRRHIAALFPDLPKVEMFRRGDAPDGWDVWGNEAEA